MVIFFFVKSIMVITKCLTGQKEILKKIRKKEKKENVIVSAHKEKSNNIIIINMQ